MRRMNPLLCDRVDVVKLRKTSLNTLPVDDACVDVDSK